jgi:hypothetical protein
VTLPQYSRLFAGVQLQPRGSEVFGTDTAVATVKRTCVSNVQSGTEPRRLRVLDTPLRFSLSTMSSVSEGKLRYRTKYSAVNVPPAPEFSSDSFFSTRQSICRPTGLSSETTMPALVRDTVRLTTSDMDFDVKPRSHSAPRQRPATPKRAQMVGPRVPPRRHRSRGARSRRHRLKLKGPGPRPIQRCSRR